MKAAAQLTCGPARLLREGLLATTTQRMVQRILDKLQRRRLQQSSPLRWKKWNGSQSNHRGALQTTVCSGLLPPKPRKASRLRSQLLMLGGHRLFSMPGLRQAVVIALP